MKTTSILSIVVCVGFWGSLGTARVAADEATFNQAAAATGQQYGQLRDQLLKQGLARDDLASAARSIDWRQRGTALSLMGWREHGDKYSRLIQAEKVRDLRGRERYLWSTDPEQVDATLLPLAYEFLLKDTGGAAGEEAAVRMIPYLVKAENAQDMKVLAGAIYDPELSPQSRVTMARVIAGTPGDAFHLADLRKMISAEPQRKQANQEVVDWLLNGLVARAAQADQASKREITSWLAESSDVSRLVGRRRVVYTLGAMGADNAVPIVAEFLERADSVTDQQWALSNLARMGSSDAANAIIKVLANRSADPGIRAVAASSLTQVEYSSAVKNVLDEVMRDERLDPALRRAAYDAINKQLETNRGNEDRVREIRDVLRGVDPKGFRKIPGLRDDRDRGDQNRR